MIEKYKSLSLLLIIIFMFMCSILFSTVKADTSSLAERRESFYTVTLPKSIDMGTATIKNFNYEVEGYIRQTEVVKVTADKSYTLYRTDDPATIVEGTTTLNDNIFDSDMLLLGANTGTGTVTSNPTKAGSYTGNVIFHLEIGLREGYIYLDFDANGGNLTETRRTVPTGFAYGTLPVPVKEGYTFAGWYTSATGGTLVQESTIASSTDTTIYARWKENLSVTLTGGSSTNINCIDNKFYSNVASVSYSQDTQITLNNYKMFNTGNVYELEFVCESGVNFLTGMTGNISLNGVLQSGEWKQKDNSYVYTFTANTNAGYIKMKPYFTYTGSDERKAIITVNVYKK